MARFGKTRNPSRKSWENLCLAGLVAVQQFQFWPIAGITGSGMSQFFLGRQNQRQFSPRKAGFFGTLSQPEVAFIFLRAFKATGCGQGEMSGRSF